MKMKVWHSNSLTLTHVAELFKRKQELVHLLGKFQIFCVRLCQHILTHVVISTCTIAPKHRKAWSYAMVYCISSCQQLFLSSLNVWIIWCSSWLAGPCIYCTLKILTVVLYFNSHVDLYVLVGLCILWVI